MREKFESHIIYDKYTVLIVSSRIELIYYYSLLLAKNMDFLLRGVGRPYIRHLEDGDPQQQLAIDNSAVDNARHALLCGESRLAICCRPLAGPLYGTCMYGMSLKLNVPRTVVEQKLARNTQQLMDSSLYA